jgi:hypothetical protein
MKANCKPKRKSPDQGISPEVVKAVIESTKKRMLELQQLLIELRKLDLK